MGKASRLKRISLSEKREGANGYSSTGKDKDDNKSMLGKDETISKLREVNRALIAERESLKEEREAAKNNEVKWRETERELRKVISALQQHVNDAVERHSDSVQRFKLAENSISEENEMLQKEVDNSRYLLEMQNQRVEDFLVENTGPKNQLEEKEEHTIEFKSLQAKFAKKYRKLEEKHLELLKANEEHDKMILSLQRDNASLENEKSLLLQNLNEESKRSQEISVKYSNSDQRVMYLESQSLGLQTELASTKSAYDEVVVELNKIKENTTRLSNDSNQIQEEKEALNQNLLLQMSITKELEEKLLSTKSCFEELKESASKGEQQIAMLQRQLLDVAEKKDNQIFDIQCDLCAMVIQLADLKDQLSSITEEKRFLEDKNTEMERKKMANDEEQIHLKGRIGELERALDLVNKDLESSRAMAVERDRQLNDLQYQLSLLGDAKRCLHDENNSLRTELNNCTMASEQILQRSHKARELESALESVSKDLESRDMQLHQLMAERQHLIEHHVHENKKSNSVDDNGIIDSAHGKENISRVHENGEPKGVCANGKPSNAHEKQPRGKENSRR